MTYQSLNLTKVKKVGGSVVWVIVLTGDSDEPSKFEQREFASFSAAKEYINSLSL